MFARVISRSKFTLPSLKYSYDALEPVVSEKIMELHHRYAPSHSAPRVTRTQRARADC